MAKKNKKNKYDFDGSYQERMMQELDELIYGSSSSDDEDIVSMLSRSLSCESQDYVPEKPQNTSGRYAYMQNGYREEPEVEETSGKLQVSSLYGKIGDKLNIMFEKSIRVFFYEDTNIFTIKDSHRSISIDLKLLDCDDSNDTLDEEDIVDLFSMTLLSSMPNLYPSGIISNAKLNNAFKNIQAINEGNFIFVRCPFKDNMTLMYHISDDSWAEINNAIQTSVDMGCSISFINTIRSVLEINGVSFRNVNIDTIDAIVANSENNISCSMILEAINDSEYTIKSDGENSDFTDVVNIIEFDLDDDDEYYEDESDDEEVDSEDTEDVKDESGDEYNEEVDSTDSEKDEPLETEHGASLESEEVVINSKTEEVSVEEERVEVPPIDDEDDDDGEIDLGEEDEPEEMDHEEAEAYYFGNKPAPRESMKSSKNNDDFIVKPRRRNN